MHEDAVGCAREARVAADGSVQVQFSREIGDRFGEVEFADHAGSEQ